MEYLYEGEDLNSVTFKRYLFFLDGKSLQMVSFIIYRGNEEFSSAPGVQQPKEYFDLSTENLDALR